MASDDVPQEAPGTAPREYTADDIQVLEGLEAVRLRPGMYIGDTGERGMHHLVYEIVDNAIDEAMAGFCNEIHIRIDPENTVSVTDDGRGIPTGINAKQGEPGLTVAYTTLHAGGKFKKDVYAVSGGLHGVGASVVNALSESCNVEVHQNGQIHTQSFVRGVATGPMTSGGSTQKTGTIVTFRPDRQIFGDRGFDADVLAPRFRELAFLNKGILIEFTDARTDPAHAHAFRFEGGIQEFVTMLNEGRRVLHEDVIYVDRVEQGVNVEIAAQFHDGYQENIHSFANNIRTGEGGTHVSGFKSALTQALSTYAKRENIFKGPGKPSGDDYREGLTAVVSVKVADPQFEGQTKTKLGNGEVEGIVKKVWGECIKIFAEENPKSTRAILDKVLQAFQAREAARKARDLVRRKSALSSGGLPGKLSDCTSRDAAQTEIMLVEGESAGGSAKMARDRFFQAILPLRGKILNVEKARIDKMLAHEEIRALITALGTGIGNEEFDATRCRYARVIIMTDADVDGSHIRTLLLTFLFRHMRPLIEEGKVYAACPPLYRVKKGKSERWIFEEDDLQRWLEELGAESLALTPGSHGSYAAIGGVRLKNLVTALSRFATLLHSVYQRGVPAEDYVAAMREDGSFPTTLAISSLNPDNHVLLFGQAELDAFLEQERALRKGEDIHVVSTDDDIDVGGEAADVTLTPLYASSDLQDVAREIEGFGPSVKHWFASSGVPELRFQLQREGQEPAEFECLRDVLEAIRQSGQRGIDVTRYKGLGEMNPDQLWETTMDPDRRTLMRIRLSDAVEADRLFSLLMGESVEPRRAFIERHALEVTELDI